MYSWPGQCLAVSTGQHDHWWPLLSKECRKLHLLSPSFSGADPGLFWTYRAAASLWKARSASTWGRWVPGD